MDEFKTDGDFRPDVNDRRPTRSSHRRTGLFNQWRWSISRQHLMILVGIVVLLLLLVGIGTALKKPQRAEQTQTAKEINLPESHSPSGVSDDNQLAQTPKEIRGPTISNTPTEAAPLSQQGQRRIELPGTLTEAVTEHQDAVNSLSQEVLAGQTLPTESATLKAADGKTSSIKKDDHPMVAKDHNLAPKIGVSQPSTTMATRETQKPTIGSDKMVTNSVNPSLQKMPVNHFTLQLSGASRQDTLQAFAKRHHLSRYWVYETRRDGKSWYVLIHGDYATSTEAKRAIANLPTEVQATKPWVKSIRQVQQELKKKQ